MSTMPSPVPPRSPGTAVTTTTDSPPPVAAQEGTDDSIIHVERVGRGHRLRTSLWLAAPIDELFPFFADAFNLELITPPLLRFRVVTPRPITMSEGTLIDYRLRLRGVPLRWRTRIAAWQPPHRFVDEQLRGPYRWWVHEHTFEPRDGGTLCRDRVDYGVPGGPLVHRLLVERDVRAIFTFRRRKLAELFGTAR